MDSLTAADSISLQHQATVRATLSPTAGPIDLLNGAICPLFGSPVAPPEEQSAQRKTLRKWSFPLKGRSWAELSIGSSLITAGLLCCQTRKVDGELPRTLGSSLCSRTHFHSFSMKQWAGTEDAAPGVSVQPLSWLRGPNLGNSERTLNVAWTQRRARLSLLGR